MKEVIETADVQRLDIFLQLRQVVFDMRLVILLHLGFVVAIDLVGYKPANQGPK